MLGLVAVLATAAVGCGDEFTPDSEPPAPPCHPTELEDDFNGATPNQLWLLHQEAGAVGVAGGHGFAEVPAGISGQGAWFSTHRSYDVRGCQVWVEVPLVPPGDLDGGALFSVMVDQDDMALFETSGGELGMGLLVGGAFQAGTSTSYDPVQHRWWRIRDDAGIIYFETSGDGLTWRVLLQTETPALLDAVHVLLGVQVLAPYSGVVRAEFDNLNLLP